MINAAIIGLGWWGKNLVNAVRRSEADKPDLWTIVKQPSLWGTVLGLFSSNYVFYFMLTWLPFYLVQERGFSTAEMAQLAGIAYAVNALSAIASGWVTDRLIAQGASTNLVYKTVMVVTHLGSVVCMLCMALGSRPVALGAIFGFQVLCGVQSPGVYAIPQILAGPRAAGRWVGIQNSLGNFAGIIAPAATGFIIASTHRFTAAFLLAAAVSILGVIGWWWMLPALEALRWEGEAEAGDAAAAADFSAPAGNVQ